MPIWDGYPETISALAVTEACVHFLGRPCVEAMASAGIVLPEMVKIGALEAFVRQSTMHPPDYRTSDRVRTTIYNDLLFAAILREAIRLQWKSVYYDGTVGVCLAKLLK